MVMIRCVSESAMDTLCPLISISRNFLRQRQSSRISAGFSEGAADRSFRVISILVPATGSFGPAKSFGIVGASAVRAKL